MQYIFKVFQAFAVASKITTIQPLNAGHINDTFLVITTKKPYLVLQKINSNVFPDIPSLMRNKVLISQYLQAKKTREVVRFIPTKTGQYYYRDEFGEYWNMMYYIDDSVTYEQVPNTKVAYEGGWVTGQFLAQTKGLDVTQFYEVLPKFHSLRYRLQQFAEALAKATPIKANEAVKEVAFVANYQEKMSLIETAIEQGELALQVTHNDTKISNILFDKQAQALCLIDLDTVMPGVLHYDYGDALRTICSTAKEDEKDLTKVDFNMTYFKAYTDGFLAGMSGRITAQERALLWASIPLMPFIIGLRFLTDFLHGDVYFKTTHYAHNWERAKNQFALVRQILDKEQEIKAYIKNIP